MYVFTSAIFFLVFFIVYNPRKTILNTDKPLTYQERVNKINDFQNELKKKENDTSILIKEIELLKDSTKVITNLDLIKAAGRGVFGEVDHKYYRTISEYDSVQHRLRPAEKDGWLKRAITKKQIQLNTKYKNDPNEASTNLLEIFLHKLPYLLFISLPVFALILKLLYVRRKQFLYTDHAIFSIHHYIFSFILLLFIFLLGAVRTSPGFHWLRIIEIGLFILWPVYLYMAVVNFYKQGWFKTFVKFFLLNILGFFTLLLLFVIFFILSLIQL